jgi:hypothetical protein
VIDADDLLPSLVKALAWHAALRTGACDLMQGGRLAGSVPLVYIDKNPWGRRFDDPSVGRNKSEALAFEGIRSRVRSGLVRLVFDPIVLGDGMPKDRQESASREALVELIGLRLGGYPVIFHDHRVDTETVAEYLFQDRGIRGADAIHAAAALLEGAWYFVTGDDALRKRLNRAYVAWSLPSSAGTPNQILALLDQGSPIV